MKRHGELAVVTVRFVRYVQRSILLLELELNSNKKLIQWCLLLLLVLLL